MVLIDGHVHFHACHPLDDALDAAARNAARACGSPEIVLWLVEARGEGSLERVRSHERGRWRRFRRDEVTWEMRREPDSRILIVAGRQLTTAEDLEVLLVGTGAAPAEGRSLPATVEPWLGGDALVMLPWGFGKWTGSRGRVVERAYDDYAAAGLRLADTGLRTAWMPRPGLFARSERDRRPVLTGSDPLPFPERIDAIGGTGMVLSADGEAARAEAGGPSDLSWPVLRRRVAALEAPVRRFGGRLSTPDFISLQARMQVRKRLRGGR